MRSRFFSALFLILLCVRVAAIPARIVVSGPDAKPLAGADIRVLERLNYVKIVGTRDEKTDANGVLALDLSDEKDPKHSYFVRVSAPGLAVTGGPVSAGETKFQLQTGQKWGGIVLDSDQKPVAGVTLRFFGWHSDKWKEWQKSMRSGSGLEVDLALETVTDAEGHYLFDAIPLAGYAGLETKDSRFQKSNLIVDLSAPQAPPIFVKTGATVTGRIVTGDGKPLGNIEVAYYNGEQFQNSHVENDGTFSIGGLGPQVRALRCFEVIDGWFLPSLSFEPLKAGQTMILPDWVAKHPLEVSGQVVDAVTRKPLPGVSVNVMAETQANGKTDAKGRFTFQISPDIYFARFEGEGHVETTLQRVSVPQGASKTDLGIIALPPGTIVGGTARDENGAVLPNVSVTFENRQQGVSKWANFQDGKMDPVTLAAGTYTLASNDSALEISSPKTVVVPAPGQFLAPLEVVLKPKDDTTLSLKNGPLLATGRVVDAGGQPVAGAVLDFKKEGNQMVTEGTIASGIDGRFRAFYFGEKPVIEDIERPGFVFSGTSEAQKTETGWQMGDVVMTPKGQIFKGRVMAQGQPVAGAWVALAGNNWREPVQTDASGTFAMEDLPQGAIELFCAKASNFGSLEMRGMAADAGSFGSLKTRGDAKDVVMTLEAISVDDSTLIDQVLKEQTDYWNWLTYFDMMGAAQMKVIALRADGAFESGGNLIPGKAEGNTAQYIGDLAQRDPAFLLEEGPKLIPLFKVGTSKWQAESVLARVQATSDDENVREMALNWLEREKKADLGLDAEAVSRRLALACVAARLKHPDTTRLLDFALNVAAQLPESIQRDYAPGWGGQAALISGEAVDSLCQDIEPTVEMRVLSKSVAVFAWSGDILSARRALERMEKLQTDPKVQAADKNSGTPNAVYFDSSGLLSEAKQSFASALAATDGAAALQIAKTMDTQKNLIPGLRSLLEIGFQAQKNGQKEVAQTALRAVFESNLLSADYGAQAAAIAMNFDPKLGQELFEKSRSQAKPTRQNSDYQPSIGLWAFHYTPIDAGLSRVLLEREWSWRQPAYEAAIRKNPQDLYNSHENSINSLAVGMAAIDPQRALLWAQSLPETNDMRKRLRAKVVAALLAKPQQRLLIELFSPPMP